MDRNALVAEAVRLFLKPGYSGKVKVLKLGSGNRDN